MLSKKTNDADVIGYCCMRFPVTDLKKSVDFYCNVLGYELTSSDFSFGEAHITLKNGNGPGVFLMETKRRSLIRWGIRINYILHECSKNLMASHRAIIGKAGIGFMLELQHSYQKKCGREAISPLFDHTLRFNNSGLFRKKRPLQIGSSITCPTP